MAPLATTPILRKSPAISGNMGRIMLRSGMQFNEIFFAFSSVDIFTTVPFCSLELEKVVCFSFHY